MKKALFQKAAALIAAIALLGCLNISGAATADDIGAAMNDTAAYVLKTVKNPQVGSVGGEWAVIGLARSGFAVDASWYQNYYATVEDYVKACKGVLHDKKYTEYSRVILALTSIGKDPSNVAGYNLLTALGDYDKTIWQGLNGPIWALISLDSGNYPMPKNPEAKTQATRDMYIDRILACQLPDGGFSLFGGTKAAASGDSKADPDITAMALQALAKYQSRADVKAATDKALLCLSNMQDSKGGYASWGTSNSESVAQVITALGELGIPVDDSRFMKNGYSLVDNLLTYYAKGSGFRHTADGSGSNQMATEQALYALVSARRNIGGQKSLYRMSDAISFSGSAGTDLKKGQGLAGKNPDVTAREIMYPDKSFKDLPAEGPHKNQAAIIALASRGVIGGYEDGSFKPDNTMTRAEFAAIIVKSLGLKPKASGAFDDVADTSWCAPYVGTANTYGIVNGSAPGAFNPDGTITREEAAVMVARAAKLCGMDTAKTSAEIRDTLAQFDDYVKVSGWAQEAMAFCFGSGVLDQSEQEIQPSLAITRGEIAQMLFNMLGKANLL